MTYRDYKIASISRLIYPDPAASALQTITMAATLSKYAGGTFLFVHDLKVPEIEIRQQYGLEDAPLKLWSLKLHRWPKWLYRQSLPRMLAYNSAVAARLALHHQWRKAAGTRPVLFVRSRLEGLYWGLLRPYLWWMRDWIFVYEIHDLEIEAHPMSSSDLHAAAPRKKRLTQTLKNYDLVLAKTRQLADDLRVLTNNAVEPETFANGSALRVEAVPQLRIASDRVVLGYIGTVDLSHGVDEVLTAIQLLPEHWRLRIVGRVASDSQAWFDQQMQNPAIAHRVELKSPVAYFDVGREIDDCDIVLAPAGNTVLSHRYRSPLKIFDYMARGKPILAANVPAHLELLTDGVNACLYQSGNPQDLAAKATALVEQPERAQAIAQAAWEFSADYTYDSRARHLLGLIDSVWREKHPSAKHPGG